MASNSCINAELLKLSQNVFTVLNTSMHSCDWKPLPLPPQGIVMETPFPLPPRGI